MNTTEELIDCPASLDRMYCAAEKFVIHRVTRAELKANGGVCAACRKKFRKHNVGCVRGEAETPAEFHPNHLATVEEDHVAYVEGPGEVHPTVNFDYDEIDRGNPLVAELTEADGPETFADALREILNWVWNDGRLVTRTSSAVLRFAAMSAALNPRLLNDESYSQIGARFGVTKAAVSKAALLFSDEFGLHMSRSRQESLRAKLSAIALGHAPSNKGPRATPPSKDSFES